jgi:RNA polymerase sigma-70 factor (ECF subfamily)
MAIQQHIDETSLLARIAQQEPSAMEQLYDRYARILYAVAFKILESVEEAEEVVLDVFCQVWRTAGSYNASRGRVDAWLFMMTRSRALDRLRVLARMARVKNTSVDAAALQPKALMADPQEEALIRERRERVLAALCQLPDEQRQVLELAYYQGLTHLEIAAKTGKSLGTVKTRIRLGLSKLRGVIDS